MTVGTLCHMLRVRLTSIIRSRRIDDAHKARFHSLDMGPRLAGYCTLVASSGAVELGQEGKNAACGIWIISTGMNLRAQFIIIIIESIRLDLTYFMSPTTERGMTRLLHQNSEDGCTCGLAYYQNP